MKWDDLLSARRVGMYANSSNKRGNDLRSEFEKDYHRIIGSASFRRLQDKTQVFPLDKSDFIRTRLTHSLEVSSFAKSLGQNIAQYIIQNKLDLTFTEKTKEDISSILSSAGLIHDIGNPPFGHFGESVIREWFVKNLPSLRFMETPLTKCLNKQMLMDLVHFEGNAQVLRLVGKLHFLVNENGMNLTYGLLNTIIKYPVSSARIDVNSGTIINKKMGYFYAEKSLFDEISQSTTTNGCRHPLTYILEAADDIAYTTADVEDAYKKGFITYDRLLEDLKTAQSRYAKQDDGLDALGMLLKQYETGCLRGISDPKLYAVQNWVVRLQSALIFSATYGFTSNYHAIMDGKYRYD
ncbi:MAG: dGTP triphosphohydrolase, partial [Lachnospiraceae bacterium]